MHECAGWVGIKRAYTALLQVKDCNGKCNGGALLDCHGMCGGTSTLDKCGVCGGSGYPKAHR